MDSGFIAVGQQVFILLMMIMTGFICTKKGFFSENTISEVTKFILYIIIPCVIINSFNREYDPGMMKAFGFCVLSAFCIHVFSIIIANLLVHDKDKSRECVLRFSVIFSNCGFMALPLQQAIIGDDGVLYGAAYLAVFHIFSWTYGMMMMSGSGRNFSIKKALLNPGVLSTVAGVVLFLSPFQLPSIFGSALKSLSALNTPMPMIIIGYYIAGIASLKVLKDRNLILMLVLRLVAIPMAVFLAFRLLGISGEPAVSVIIAVSTPVAVNGAMFSVLYGRDARLSAVATAVSTLFSIITMPVIVAFFMQ